MTTIGINTLVYLDDLKAGVPQSQILSTIAKHGVTLAEVRREYIDGPDEIAAIAKATKDNGLTLFYSVPELITINGKANPDLETYLDEATRLGAANVKLNQGDVKDVDASVLAAIDQAAAAHHVNITIENDQTPENGTFACTEASLKHIKEAGSAIGYTFDLGNWFWRDEDAVKAFDALQQSITFFHLKNVNGAAKREELSTTLLADGVIDWKSLVSRLDDSVPVLLEYPAPAQEVENELRQLRQAVAA